MSYSLHYHVDPGIAFDVVKMLIVKLYPVSTWRTVLLSMDAQQEGLSFIQKQASLLPDPSPEVLLFVYLVSAKRPTFLSTILSHLIQADFASFSIDCLIRYLKDAERVKRELYSYYLGDEVSKDADLDHCIRLNPNIPEKIKLLLFGFSSTPAKYLSRLVSTISLYYGKIKEAYVSAHESVDIPDEFIGKLINQTVDENALSKLSLAKNTIAYSLSYTTPEFLVFNYAANPPYLITTAQSIENVMSTSPSISPDRFIRVMKALSNKYRMQIVQHLIQKGNLTLPEIVSLLGLSETAVQHHISILKSAKLIIATRSYRKVTFHLTSKTLEDLSSALHKFTKGESLI